MRAGVAGADDQHALLTGRNCGGVGRASIVLRPKPQGEGEVPAISDQREEDGDERDRARDAGVEEIGEEHLDSEEERPLRQPADERRPGQ